MTDVAVVIKAVRVWTKNQANRSMEQNRESRNRHIEKQSTIFEKKARAIQLGKDNLFNKWH